MWETGSSQAVWHSWANTSNIAAKGWREDLGTPDKSLSKESASKAGDPGSISGSGRSPGEGNGYPLQYSCLQNSMDRGARWTTVHTVGPDWSNYHFHFQKHCISSLRERTAEHSKIVILLKAANWPYRYIYIYYQSVRSVAQSCSTLRPLDYSIPGFPVHHQFPELAQTHVHWVGDGIQPSHPLSPPSPPTFNLSQHQGLFQWVSSLHQVAKVLEFQLQHQSLQWVIQDWFPSGLTGWISLPSKGLSRVFSNTTVQKHQFFGIQLSLQSNSHIHSWLLEKP